MWCNRTAVPNIPRAGGTTLSLRRNRRQRDQGSDQRLVDVLRRDDDPVERRGTVDAVLDHSACVPVACDVAGVDARDAVDVDVGKSSSFRAVAAFDGPEPTSSARSRGVQRLQIARTVARSARRAR